MMNTGRLHKTPVSTRNSLRGFIPPLVKSAPSLVKKSVVAMNASPKVQAATALKKSFMIFI